MNIDLNRLINNYIEELKISETLILGEEYLKNTEIKKLSEIKVEGFICSSAEDLYVLSMLISGEMTLPCSITLEDVQYPFSIQIDEILSENDVEEENYIKIIDNTIDIMPIIWQNIVMEIPLKVTSPKADNIKLEGDGWRLLTDEEKNKEIDPRLEKLRDLLDEREER